jgi:hypothetical protein
MCLSRSQTSLYYCAQQKAMTFLYLSYAYSRYFLGSDRPSQTVHLELSCFIKTQLEIKNDQSSITNNK